MEVTTPSAISDGEKNAFALRGRRSLSRPISKVQVPGRKALAALLVTVVALAAIVSPVRAAIVLEYFNAVASGSAVLLEWSTASEYNVAGFEILKKRAGEPENSWHRIGFYNAKGDVNNGAQYDTLLTNLAADVVYCFRLREVTTEDEPGEVRDLCGYGLRITPTPASSPAPVTGAGVPGSASAAIAAATAGIVLFPTPTLDPIAQQQLQPTPTFDPFAQQPQPTQDPFQQQPTPDPFQQQSPLPTPTLDPFATATPTTDPFAQPAQVPVDPFATATPPLDPFATATPTIDPFATATPTIDPFATATPTFDPFATATPTIDPFAQPAAIDPITGWQIDPGTGWPVNPATGLPTEPGQAALIVQEQQQGMQPESPLPFPSDTPAFIPTATSHFPPAGAAVGDVTATPTSIYVVVTAAPAGADNSEGVAALVTPWPTVAPTPMPMLATLFAPTAQNLTVLMLCFIFLSATTLGGLGLMSVVLYLRSRNQREDDRARLRARH